MVDRYSMHCSVLSVATPVVPDESCVCRFVEHGMDVTCQGTTRAGARCKLTAASKMRDEHGRLVAEPLQRGGRFCIFHTRTFCTRHSAPPKNILLVVLDLETTGTDVAEDRIVELAAITVPASPDDPGAVFSTVVSTDSSILENRGTAAQRIHGIERSEILQGPGFVEAWRRFEEFIEYQTHVFLEYVEVQSDDEAEDVLRSPRPPDVLPTVALAAHNGYKFDFAVIAHECWRHGVDLSALSKWLFVDTLDIMQMITQTDVSCRKLQCVARKAVPHARYDAHRALGDCWTLRAVLEHLSGAEGISMHELARLCGTCFDIEASRAHLLIMS